MRPGSENFTETVTSVSKEEGTPSVATVRMYCDLGLVPHIRDANGRRLLRSDAREIVRQVYAERLARRGRPGRRSNAA